MRPLRYLYLVLAAVVVGNGGPAREVAITIDDARAGGNWAMTVKLLAPFQREHIPLVGFVNACQDPGELPSLLALWVKAGADLGNHTCSHADLNKTTAPDFEADILEGEAATTAALGHRALYFRFPFLHVGKDPETKQAVAVFLREQGYRNAPVTLDNSDYMKARRVQQTYLTYMESIFEFFESRSIKVTGHAVRQVLLIHASQLNADAMPDLLNMMHHRGYKLISLGRALQDPAYALPETYVGPGGFSWIHCWSMTKGMKNKGEPDEPEWIRKESGF